MADETKDNIHKHQEIITQEDIDAHKKFHQDKAKASADDQQQQEQEDQQAQEDAAKQEAVDQLEDTVADELVDEENQNNLDAVSL